MTKEPIFSKTGKLNLRAWDADLARRETGKRSVDRQTVAQITEVRALIMDDLAAWHRAWGKPLERWFAFRDRLRNWPVKRARTPKRRKAKRRE